MKIYADNVNIYQINKHMMEQLTYAEQTARSNRDQLTTLKMEG